MWRLSLPPPSHPLVDVQAGHVYQHCQVHRQVLEGRLQLKYWIGEFNR